MISINNAPTPIKAYMTVWDTPPPEVEEAEFAFGSNPLGDVVAETSP